MIRGTKSNKVSMAGILLLLALPAVVPAQFICTTNNGTITITGYTGDGGDVTIPDEINGLPVTSIGDWAFQSCNSLTSITLGTNITSTGAYIFYSCTNLASVSITSQLKRFEGGLFCYCSGLTNAPIPGSVTNLGYSVFLGCTSLASVSFPNHVTSVGDYCFEGCTSLTNVVIPASLSSFGTKAFDECASLRTFSVDALNPSYASVDGVLFNRDHSMILIFPPGKANSYTIPTSVIRIGSYAFSHCASLTNVDIPDSVTEIRPYAFCYCTSLTSITLPIRLTTIGFAAFDDCRSLSSVIMPDSVTSIGAWAFGYCTSLKSIVIPRNVTSIGTSAFDNCYKLAVIIVDPLNPAYCTVDGVLFNKAMTTLMRYPEGKAGTTYRIPDDVTTIGESAFYYCTGLNRVVVPNSVTNISNMVFYLCTSLYGVYFEGNAPAVGNNTFAPFQPTIYYLPGSTGWGSNFAGAQTAPWPPAIIQRPPRPQTTEVGSTVDWRLTVSVLLPSYYFWYQDDTNLVGCTTDCELELTNAQFAHSGAYTVIITNIAGAVTSPSALLNVIPAVTRQPAAAVQVAGEPGTLLNLEYADTLGFPPTWTFQGSASLTSPSQYYFDVSTPLPAQRLYRASQTTTPGARPSLRMLGIVPAITLTGSIGDSVQVDSINRFGPTDAWVTLDTVTLTNTSQLYFDTAAWGQPERLYRLVSVP
jgi:hypothetical protein